MIKTERYFNMSIDDLLEQSCADNDLTVEEKKISETGKVQTYFDDMQEYEEEKADFERWVTIEYPDTSFKAMLRTVNGRIVLIYE